MDFFFNTKDVPELVTATQHHPPCLVCHLIEKWLWAIIFFFSLMISFLLVLMGSSFDDFPNFLLSMKHLENWNPMWRHSGYTHRA